MCLQVDIIETPGPNHFPIGMADPGKYFSSQSPGQCLEWGKSKIRWINQDCDAGFESPDIKEAVNQI